MKRYYLSQIVPGGFGVQPAIAELGIPFNGQQVPGAVGAWALVDADVTAQQHNAIRADPRNLTLPFEEAVTGRVLDLDESTDLMSQQDRDRIVNRLEAVGITLHDFAGKTVRRVLARAIKRLIVRQWLGAADLPADLTSTWGQMSAAQRAAARDVLQAHGVDTVPINGPDTIRVVQAKILDQEVPALRVHLDPNLAPNLALRSR